MDFPKLRRYDVQAGLACWLAVAAVIPFALAAWQISTRYDAVLGRVIYGSQGRFLVAFVSSVLLSLALSSLGFLLGWSSAGQRRNDKSGQSWLGFFVGGTILTFDLVLLVAFYLLRLERGM